MPQIYEYRGVEGLVAAPVVEDSTANFTVGTVIELAGVSEIGKATDSTNESHYYDNKAAIVITSEGADTLTVNTSAIPLDVLANITGQYYDSATGMFVEQESTPGYWALGYQTKDTNGNVYFVWRLKGRFNKPDQTSATENDGTDANGQEITYTGVSTIHKFTKTSKSAKAITVNTSINAVTASSFFSTVQTPDTVASGTAVTGVSVSPTTATIAPLEETTITATVAPENATNKSVEFISSDTSVAIVSSAGVVKGVANGSAVIIAKTVDGGFTASAAITVTA